MKKNKKIILILFSALLLFLLAAPALALEIKYPNLPGLPNLNQNNPSLSAYIGYFFTLIVYLAGAIALISFAVGAVQLTISGDSSDMASGGKDRMKSSILGLVIVMISFFLLQTINLAFVTPTLTPLPGVNGIFYYNGKQEAAAPMQEPYVQNRSKDLITEGYNRLIYDCPADSTAPALLIWEFTKTNLDISGGVHVARINCGDTENIGSLGSFRMAFETPGVYYCLGGCGGSNGMCSGYMSGPMTSDDNNILAPFSENIKSIRIVNDPSGAVRYGVIFHGDPGLENGGLCTYPLINYGNSAQCEDIKQNVSPMSANIFKYNKNISDSGLGAILYSEPNGETAGTMDKGEGFYTVSNNMFKNIFDADADTLEFGDNYTSSTLPEYMDVCPTFQDCPGSVQLRGNYLLALYSDDYLLGQPYCETLTKSDEKKLADLNVSSFIANGSGQLDSIYIIPTK